jgi:hypothetical protein
MSDGMCAEELARDLQYVYSGDRSQAPAARERISEAFAALEFQLDKRAASWLEYQEALERAEEVLQRISDPDPLASPETERDYFAALARSYLRSAEKPE